MAFMAFLPFFQVPVVPYDGELVVAYDVRAVLFASETLVRFLPYGTKPYAIPENARPTVRSYLGKHFVKMGNLWLNPENLDWIRMGKSGRLSVSHIYSTHKYYPVADPDWQGLIEGAALIPVGRKTHVNLRKAFVYHEGEPKLYMNRKFVAIAPPRVQKIADMVRQAGWIFCEQGWVNPSEMRSLYQGRAFFNQDVSAPLELMSPKDRQRVMAMDWAVATREQQVNLRKVTAVNAAIDGSGGTISLGTDFDVDCDFNRIAEIADKLTALHDTAAPGGG